MAPNAGESLNHYQKTIYAPNEEQVMPTLRKKQEATTVPQSKIDGWRGSAVNGGFGNYQLFNYSSQDPITNFGSTSAPETDALTTISNVIAVGTAAIGLIGAGVSLFGSKKQDTSLDNNLTKQQRKAIKEATRDTSAIKDDLSRTSTDVDNFIESGSDDKNKAMQYSETLTNYINSANARKNQLSNKAAEIEKTISNKQNEYDELDGKTAKLTSQLTTAKGDLETLKNQDTSKMTEEQKKAHKEAIDKLKEQIEKLEKDIKKNKEDMTKMKDEIESLKTEKGTYTQQANELNTAIADAQKKVDKLDKIINK